jgi:hypothetical protein
MTAGLVVPFGQYSVEQLPTNHTTPSGHIIAQPTITYNADSGRVNCVYKYPLASDGVLPRGRDSSWPHSLRCSNYGASTSPRLIFPVNWQASFTGKGTDPALRTFKTRMYCGWLSIWTTYVPALSLLTHRRSYCRFWGLFTLPALHFGNAYVNSE